MDDMIGRDLAAAAGEGIISADQATRLETFIRARRTRPVLAASAPLEVAENPLEDSEMPRFVRGFHDILITIGIVILLFGIAGLTHPALTILAIIPLAELLVRRQRLALPAFTLTLAYGGAVTALVMWLMGDFFEQGSEDGAKIFLSFLIAYVLGFIPFYWRYRVPIALASMIVLCGGTFVLTVASAAEQAVYGAGAHHPVFFLSFCLAGAVLLLLTAVWHDLKDPARISRRSDVAFWLHLVTAPALLYSLLALIYYAAGGTGDGWDLGAIAREQPVVVVMVVSCFILFGLIMDRRAFVTASLLSLGFSVATLLEHRMSSFGSIFFISLLVLGSIVLTIGVLWPALRRLVVGSLPRGLQAKLPPLR